MGVVFSIDFNEISNYICTSSDDRTAILWHVNLHNLPPDIKSSSIHVKQKCKVNGHVSRIFRCRITKKCFITAGEDASIIMWDFKGNIIRKVENHGGGTIWALDIDDLNDNIVSGGADCGVTITSMFPKIDNYALTLNNDEIQPKRVGIMTSGNIAIITEKGSLYYYDFNKRAWKFIFQHADLENYALLEVSLCRTKIALAGINGELYIYKEMDNQNLCLRRECVTKSKSRIYAVHWLLCNKLLICEYSGILSFWVLDRYIIRQVCEFVLPPCKERWTTAACLIKDNLIVGDRKGNIYVYDVRETEPVQSIKRAHSHLGVSRLYNFGDLVVSLGRDSLMKSFNINTNKKRLSLMFEDKLPFTWLAFLYEHLLLAFSGGNLVIWDHQYRRTLLQTPCGGGHRSWYFQTDSKAARFAYIKDKTINIVKCDLCTLCRRDVVSGYHIRDINSAKIIKWAKEVVVISGGEDTTLRICKLNTKNVVPVFRNIAILKSHLSSIRAIELFKIDELTKDDVTTSDYFVFSAGGREQILLWKLTLTSKLDKPVQILCSAHESKYNKPAKEHAETRIMDMTSIKVDDVIFLFAACSNGDIQIYQVKNKTSDPDKFKLILIKTVPYKLRCLLKMTSFKVTDCDILLSLSTDGALAFWSVDELLDLENEGNVPFKLIPTHQSGINSYSIRSLENDKILILTGGDDNCITLSLVEIQRSNSFDVVGVDLLDAFEDEGIHCAQVTGCYIYDEYFVTTSIDQRLALFQWKVIKNRLECECLSVSQTAIADIHGMECYFDKTLNIFVYGHGIEYLELEK